MRLSGSSIAETSDVPVLSRAGTPMSLGPRTRPISTNVYGTSELGAPEEPSPVGTTTARSTTPADRPTLAELWSALATVTGEEAPADHPTPRAG